MAQIFLDSHAGMIAAIQDALDAGDAQALQRAAHTLKGSIANFGAKAATEAALALEELGRAERLEEAAERLDGLCREVDRVAEALAREVPAHGI